jgi:PAS domain S-box-containing protein
MNPLQILIADDHDFFRNSLRALVESQEGWSVCGEAVNGVDAVEKTRELKPGLVLLDVTMPEMNGLDAARAIRQHEPDTFILIVSQNDAEGMAAAAAAAGANGFIQKARVSQDLFQAVGDLVGSQANVLSNPNAENLRLNRAALLTAIVDSSDDAIVSKDLNGTITSWNQSAERIFGYSAKEAVGQHITLIIPTERWSEEDIILGCLRRGERVEHFETVRKRKDGSLLDVALTISPVRDSNGKIIGASKIARDIRTRKETEKQLATAACRQRALFQLADELHRAESLEQVYDAALDAISQALQFERASILLFDHSGVMRFVRWRGLSDEYRAVVEGHSPWTASEQDPQPICFDDAAKGGLEEALARAVQREGIAAFAFIPLVWNDRPIGKFTMYSSDAHRFAPDEISFGVTIARQLAFAIERKRADDRERMISAEAIDARAKFRALFEQTPVFAGIMTTEGVLVDANNLSLEACGYRREEVVGVAFWETPWWRNFAESREKIRAATPMVAQGLPYRELLHYSWSDGTERLVDFALYPIRDDQGKVLFLHPTGVDVTDLKHAENSYRELAERLDAEVRARTTELEKRNADVVAQAEQLRELSRRLLQIQDDERRRIARELHDSAGQTLAVMQMNLSQLVRRMQQNVPELAGESAEIEELARQLSQEIRTTSYLLHPPLLDEAGLSGALTWYTEGLAARSGLEISLSVSEHLGRLPGDIELVVFRLVQECLTNIHRHSQSTKAEIRISTKGAELLLEVRDWGKGISPERLAQIQSRGSGVGVPGMRERVRQFGGSMQIESATPGTTVYCRIPIPKEHPSARGSTAAPLKSVV